ncbi:MAG: hypothetical protein GW911_09840 [Armatimonadetes bacterium]|nr:hypothetical protein [Armatimonadota bacterium]NCO92296.1 hypothetical protein [Armatimonadota bacterium]NCP32739.1 hypothetical protein [Armatimonadota bacterium]NCQ27847.1 hypothetical protein [Armatimonadota bacterium]NDK12338.1 hypothetical protein [Armatimonadota bacterium]
MRMRRALGQTHLALLIALMTVGSTTLILTSRSALRAQEESSGAGAAPGAGPGMGPGGSEGGMGGEMGMPGMGGGGGGGAAAASAPALPAEPQIEEGMVPFPNMPGISGLANAGTFYRFNYTEVRPDGNSTFRVELPTQLEGTPVIEQKHFPAMWGQIFHIFEAGTAQRAGELPEERESRMAGARAGSKMMKARSGAEEAARVEVGDGPMPEEQVAIQRGLEAGSNLAAGRVRAAR